MHNYPVSQESITEVFQVLSNTLAKLQGTTDELRDYHDTLVDSYREVAVHSQHYQYLFDQSPSSLLMTNDKGIIYDLNWAALALLNHGMSDFKKNYYAISNNLCHDPGDRLPNGHTPKQGTMESKPGEQLDKGLSVGRSLLSYISPESSRHVLDYLTSLNQTPTATTHPLDTWVISANGEQRWVRLTATVLQHSGYPAHSIYWTITDITDRLQVELELKSQNNEVHESYANVQQENQQLAAAVQTKSSQVLKATEFESALKRITDKVRDSLDESKILQTVVRELSTVLRIGGCNTALYDWEKGTSTISYEYTNYIAAYRGKVAQMDRFPEIYNQLKKGYSFQFCSLIPNPERGQVALLACPIFVDPDGGADGGETVLGDLWLIDRQEHMFNEYEIRLVQQVASQCAIAIRQARLYEASQSQVHELEKLNRLKDEFLSTVSHELRTPISNVKMAVHMLKNAKTEDKRQQYIHILETESQREANLINDLLDLQKLEQSTYAIAPKILPIVPWLEDVLQPFYSRVSTHQQELKLDCAEALTTLKTDFNVLERIVAELINNACKYTPSNHDIRVKIRAEGDRQIQFIISNQAEIPASELPHIFDKFYRVPHSDPWKQGGTGLGLALVEKLVQQLKGTITVSSQDGWTHFTVTLANAP
ncbi:MAG: GAF domain-containing sensor histidine kinase [Leptolyngbyaceae bacterium]|nr:GAF domain-containing sensor histidine kinase [Leptolyngbyaceae bacterium]